MIIQTMSEFNTAIQLSPANGINKDSTKSARAFNQSLCWHNSKLYASWTEANASAIEQVRVAVWNGSTSAPSWTFVDGNSATVGINRDSTKTTGLASALVSYGGNLYALWTELNTAATAKHQVRVKRYNGNDLSPTWTSVDSGTNTLGLNKAATEDATVASGAGYVNAVVMGSNLYVAWAEESGASDIPNVRVKRYNGSAWAFIDGNGVAGINVDTTKNVWSFHLHTFGGKLYIAIDEVSTTGIRDVRVKVWNGNEGTPVWTNLTPGANGLGNDPAFSANQPNLFNDGTSLYCGYQHLTSPTRSRVKKFNGNEGAPAWSEFDGSNTIYANASVSAAAPFGVNFDGVSNYLCWTEGSTPTVARLGAFDGSISPAVNGTVSFTGDATSNLSGFKSMVVNNRQIYVAVVNTTSSVFRLHVFTFA
jgi:hypothetical protein